MMGLFAATAVHLARVQQLLENGMRLLGQFPGKSAVGGCYFEPLAHQGDGDVPTVWD